MTERVKRVKIRVKRVKIRVKRHEDKREKG